MSVGKRLRMARERMDMTQVSVFKKIGINNKTLSGYENETNSPDYETILKLARLYNVSVAWIISGEEEPTEPVELKKLLNDTEIQLRGIKLSKEDKQRIYDVVTGLYWERITKNDKN